MEKICEFCTTSRPVVYCKADAAHLCLSCDAKVHSANALSSRHLRTLLCDSCRCRPSHVRCFDHRMFMCRGCDQSVHNVSSQHHRRSVSSYLGCPSAKDFAALWGFELNELDNNAIKNHSLSKSFASVNPLAVKNDNLGQSCSRVGIPSNKSGVTCVLAAGCNIGSNSQQTKVINKGQQQQNSSFILQQILDLKKLQLTEGDSHLPFIGGQEQADKSSSVCNSSKVLDGNVVQDIGINLHKNNNPLQEQTADPLPLSFTHLENLGSSSTSGIPLYGEPFWQCKSPTRSSQLWSQNMQDLGVCEDIFCQDDFNMPEIDLTFCNFEDLFGGDQDPISALLEAKYVSCSSVGKDSSFIKSDNSNSRPLEGLIGSPRPIRTSYSTMSFSLSRFSAESSGTDCVDSGVSPISQAQASGFSLDLDNSEARENAMNRYNKKKKARLNEKQVLVESQKATADVRKRVKRRFPKMKDVYDSDKNANVTKSY